MQQSAHQNSVRVSRDKSRPYKKVVQTMKLSRTLNQDSTTTENNSGTFWNRSTSEMSNKLLYPTGIDCVGTDLNSSNLCANSTPRKSWLIINQKQRVSNRNSLKISWPSVISSSQGIMGEEVEEIKDIPSRKIKLNPTVEWKVLLNKWMGTSRWMYNRCLGPFNKGKCKMSRKGFRSTVVGNWNHGAKKKRNNKKKKRGKNKGNWSVPKDTIKKDSLTSWVLDTPSPFMIRDSAMVDLCSAFDTNMKKRATNPDHVFKLKFRSKKDIQSINIPGKSAKDGYMFKSFCGPEKLGGFEDWSSFSGEIVIQKDLCGDYYAYVTEQNDIIPSNCEDTNDLKVVALDPCVRTFHTGVDNKGNVTEFGPGDIGRIYRLCHYMGKLQSRAFDKSLNSKRRYKLCKAWHRSIKRVRNLVMFGIRLSSIYVRITMQFSFQNSIRLRW